MKAKDLTFESLSRAIRTMRTAAGLTQFEVHTRTATLNPPLKSVTPGQVSDFERGQNVSTIWKLLSFVVACSADGDTVDLMLLQRGLERASAPGEATKDVALEQSGEGST